MLLARAAEARRQERRARFELPTVTIMLWGNQLHDPDTERTLAEVDAVGRQENGDWIELSRSPHHYSPSGGGGGGGFGGGGGDPAPPMTSPYTAAPMASGAAGGYGYAYGACSTPPPQSRYGMY